MAKGFGKFLAGAVIAGAAAAGIYYFLKAKEDEDDFDDFDDDVNDDLEDFLKDETAAETSGDDNKSKREYVPLNFNQESVDAAKEKIVGNAEKAGEEAAKVVKDTAAAASEFKFTDLTGNKQ